MDVDRKTNVLIALSLSFLEVIAMERIVSSAAWVFHVLE